jgi:hypothetical protein
MQCLLSLKVGAQGTKELKKMKKVQHDRTAGLIADVQFAVSAKGFVRLFQQVPRGLQAFARLNRSLSFPRNQDYSDYRPAKTMFSSLRFRTIPGGIS